MKYIIVIISISLIAGCASFTSPARYHELDTKKSYWIDYDVTRRGAIVSGGESAWKGCAEPAPDAAIGLVAKLEGSLDVATKGKVDGKGELTQSIVSLAEKTQMVLFLRESLFRLCELTMNTNIDAGKAKELYQAVIGASLALVEKERSQINLDLKRLESADKAEFIYGYLNEKKVDPEIIQGLLKSFK